MVVGTFPAVLSNRNVHPPRAAELPGGAAPPCRHTGRTAGEPRPAPHAGRRDGAGTVGIGRDGDAVDVAERRRVPDVGLDRGDDYAGFELNEVDAGQRDPDPCLDHDVLVEGAIEDIDRARGWQRPLRMHRERSWQVRCRQRAIPGGGAALPRQRCAAPLAQQHQPR